MLETYTLEIASVMPPPINLKICDSLNCPICDIDLSDELGIDLETFVVDDNTSIYCKDCDLIIKFKIKRF